MKPPFHIIEVAADQAATHHLSFVQSMKLMERQLLASGSGMTARGVRDLRSSLETFLDSYETTVSSVLRDDLARIIPDASEEIIATSFEYGVEEIINQSERDASQILKYHRNLSLSASVEAAARGVSVETAMFDKRIRALNESVNTWFTDRAGRKIASQKHIRRFYRALLLETHRNAFARSLALRGELTARVAHPDPSHRAFGAVVHLDGSGVGIEDFDDVFHPNTNAYLISEEAFKELYT